MQTIKIIALIGMIAMAGIILYAFIVGDFLGEGSTLLGMPWGIVSMVDLYVGFTVFSCWIAYREDSLPRIIVWIVLMVTLGSFTACLYTFIAAQSSDGDWNKFWNGSRSG